MELKTILNHVERHKSFVYQDARWANPQTKSTNEISIQPRTNGRAVCSGCGRTAPGYDRLPERRFEFVPLWQIAVYFVYAMRRVNCPTCGVKVERVPWCDGKHSLTTTNRWFLAGWARRLSWQGVAEVFGTTWQNVLRSVKHAVSWGLAHRDLAGIESIGVDEVQWQRGHCFVSSQVRHFPVSLRYRWVHAPRAGWVDVTASSFPGERAGRDMCLFHVRGDFRNRLRPTDLRRRVGWLEGCFACFVICTRTIAIVQDVTIKELEAPVVLSAGHGNTRCYLKRRNTYCLAAAIPRCTACYTRGQAAR